MINAREKMFDNYQKLSLILNKKSTTAIFTTN